MNTLIRKAVFPVAGLGTRLLPITKANPKEMLPIIDKPLIQFAVEEAISAGITELIFITCASRTTVESYFSADEDLEGKLQDRGQARLLALVKGILPTGISCTYIQQSAPLGLGHAVWCAKNAVGNEPFALLLADDVIDNPQQSCLAQMMPIYHKTQSSVIAVRPVDWPDVEKYGIVSLEPDSQKLRTVIEKPARDKAPSNLAVVGRYLLTPRVFALLEDVHPGVNGEIQLTDALAKLLQEENMYTLAFQGKHYDCGNKLGYVKAIMHYALQHPELKTAFADYLNGMMAMGQK